MPKPKYQTYHITETIHIHQQIFAKSKKDALRQYNEMMEDRENRYFLTCDGATDAGSTDTDIVVRTTKEQDERDWELENL